MSHGKTLFILIISSTISGLKAQNYVRAPIGVFGLQYASKTIIGSNGTITVDNNGNWFLGGDIISEDKGNSNAPNNTGRTEQILFKGTGTYSNVPTSPGASGNIIDGYAVVSNKSNEFSLPIGFDGRIYPIKVPQGSSVSAAYFAGSGNTQNVGINGSNSSSSIEFSPFLDMPLGIPSGDYELSYPDGLNTSGADSSAIVETNNTSAYGTNSSTQYNLVSTIALLNPTADKFTVSLNKDYLATQIYFADIMAYALPVTMVDFTGTPSGNSILLQWATVTEINNQGFTVQRSTDGKSFSAIGYRASLATDGSSSSPLRYSFEDPSPAAGTNYYRLKQVDFDGTSAYSNVVPIYNTGISSTIQLYPNPATAVIYLANVPVGSNIQLTDLKGAVLKTVTVHNANCQIDVSNMRSGMYLVRIPDALGKDVKTLKFVKR